MSFSSETRGLYERFTDKAREAFRTTGCLENLSKKSIDSTHILTGLITNPSSCIVSILRHFGIEIQKIESDIKESSVASDETEECKNIILSAIDSSKLKNHNYVGTEHILRGILERKETIASKILESNGLTKETFDELFNDPEKWSNLIL
jgi:ATP-dependent Clp protease ATP-binding subunit ClpA